MGGFSINQSVTTKLYSQLNFTNHKCTNLYQTVPTNKPIYIKPYQTVLQPNSTNPYQTETNLPVTNHSKLYQTINFLIKVIQIVKKLDIGI